MRAAAVAATALSLLMAACGPAAQEAKSPSPDSTAPGPGAPSTTTPGDGPDPNPPPAVPAAAPQNAAAAQVASGFVAAAYTTGGDTAARVAPYVTDRLLAEFTAPAASTNAGRDLEAATAVVEAVHPLAPVNTRWRFEVVVAVNETTTTEPVTRGAVLVIDVADTPLGPRVDAVR